MSRIVTQSTSARSKKELREIIPTGKNGEFVAKDSTIDPLLLNLLVQPTPNGHEHLMHKYLPDGGVFDEKGNYTLKLGQWEVSQTMFACHMDTVHSETGVHQYLNNSVKPDVRVSIIEGTDKFGLKIPSVAHKDATGYIIRVVGVPYGWALSLDGKTPRGNVTWDKSVRIISMSVKLARSKIFVIRDPSSHIAKPSCDFTCTVQATAYSKGDPTKLRLWESVGPFVQDEGYIFATDSKGNPEVLGADDKAGMYCMLKLIEANVPGLYVFHMGEEVGCVGSKFYAKENVELLSKMKRCISFDRKDTGDIIHTQRGRRCCSDAFVDSFASELEIGMPKGTRFSGTTGVYTDSAEYAHIIPECTNLSVGYYSQHTEDEHQDAYFLTQLLVPALIEVEWSSLETKRDPKEVVTTSYSGNYGNWGYGKHKDWSRVSSWTDVEDYPDTDKISVEGLPANCPFLYFSRLAMHNILEKGARETLKPLYEAAIALNKANIKIAELEAKVARAQAVVEVKGTEDVKEPSEKSD